MIRTAITGICSAALSVSAAATALGDIACPADCAPNPVGDGIVNTDDLVGLISAWGSSNCHYDFAPAPPIPPYSGDGIVDVQDLVALIGAWGPCPGSGGAAEIGACMIGGSYSCIPATRAECASAGGIGWQPGACTDSDDDHIADVFETNDCRRRCGNLIGTDPGDADTDDDALLDGDETFVAVADRLTIDLAAMGADPLRKTVFLEVDWMEDNPSHHKHRPTDAAVATFQSAFANAPVANPCPSSGDGITLIIDYGQGGPGGLFTGGNLLGNDTVIEWVGPEFNTLKAANLSPARKPFFHYAIYAHNFSWNGAIQVASGISELSGNDHMVTIVSANNPYLARTMMHELGHNFGLEHGGFNNINRKPNYNSVMNYRYTNVGLDADCDGDGDGGIGYSSGTLPPLNESTLNESAGMCPGTPIDWNCNGQIDAGLIAHNITCQTSCASNVCGSGAAGCDTLCNLLSDYDDWGNLDFAGLLDADFAPPESIVCELE